MTGLNPCLGCIFALTVSFTVSHTSFCISFLAFHHRWNASKISRDSMAIRIFTAAKKCLAISTMDANYRHFCIAFHVKSRGSNQLRGRCKWKRTIPQILGQKRQIYNVHDRHNWSKKLFTVLLPLKGHDSTFNFLSNWKAVTVHKTFVQYRFPNHSLTL